MRRSFVVVALVLSMLAIVAQGAGLAPHPTTVIHVDARGAGTERMHWHTFGKGQSHRECGHSDQPDRPQDQGTPDHVHRCTTAFVAASPRNLDAGSVPFVLTPAIFAVVSVDDVATPSSLVPGCPLGRWCAGPPPSIRTTRLLV